MFSKIPPTFMHRKVVYIDINGIHKSKSSPNTINEKLKKDILKNGMLYPLQIQSQLYQNCFIGNQRLLILQSLSVRRVPVIFLSERTESKKRVYNNLKYPNLGYFKNANHISGKERRKKEKKKKIRVRLLAA